MKSKETTIETRGVKAYIAPAVLSFALGSECHLLAASDLGVGAGAGRDGYNGDDDDPFSDPSGTGRGGYGPGDDPFAPPPSPVPTISNYISKFRSSKTLD